MGNSPDTLSVKRAALLGNDISIDQPRRIPTRSKLKVHQNEFDQQDDQVVIYQYDKHYQWNGRMVVSREHQFYPTFYHWKHLVII